MNQLLMAILQDHEASLPAIIDYWRTIAEHAKDETFCAGCLIVNVAVEVAPHDSDVSAEVQRIDRKYQALFTRAIQNGQMNDWSVFENAALRKFFIGPESLFCYMPRSRIKIVAGSLSDLWAVAFAYFVVRWRWRVILANVLAVMGAEAGGRRLEFAKNTRTLNPAHRP